MASVERPPMITCRFCDTPAVAVYTFSDGCICFPDDREQALCAQHEDRATPLGSMELLREIGGPDDGGR